MLNYSNYLLGPEDPITRQISTELQRHSTIPTHGAGFSLVAAIVVIPGQSQPPVQKQPPSLSGNDLNPEEETALMDRFTDVCERLVQNCSLQISCLVELGLMEPRVNSSSTPAASEPSATSPSNPPT